MGNILRVSEFGNYSSGNLEYSMSRNKAEEDYTTNIILPKELQINKNSGKYLGTIAYQMPNLDSFLELTNVFPLGSAFSLKRTGLGSFILSQTFMKIYQDSFDNEDIFPNTSILVNTKTSELISILKNRGFEEGSYGYITTIQEAGEKSERILRERNWI